MSDEASSSAAILALLIDGATGFLRELEDKGIWLGNLAQDSFAARELTNRAVARPYPNKVIILPKLPDQDGFLACISFSWDFSRAATAGNRGSIRLVMVPIAEAKDGKIAATILRYDDFEPNDNAPFAHVQMCEGPGDATEGPYDYFLEPLTLKSMPGTLPRIPLPRAKPVDFTGLLLVVVLSLYGATSPLFGAALAEATIPVQKAVKGYLGN